MIKFSLDLIVSSLSKYHMQEYMGTGGMGWGVVGGVGVGVKNKFGLKCFLDDFKCYKAFFFPFLF